MNNLDAAKTNLNEKAKKTPNLKLHTQTLRVEFISVILDRVDVHTFAELLTCVAQGELQSLCQGDSSDLLQAPSSR